MGEIFMRLILKEDFEKFMTSTVEYFKEDEECMVTDLKDILNEVSIATLLIGFNRKPVNFDAYEVKLKKKNIKVNTKDFCEKFKEYIQKVEDVKFEMLKDIT